MLPTYGEAVMTFEALLAQILAVLQHERRVSYRALKRRFNLTDDDLADLHDELIAAKQLARDEDGKVLVWTGGPTAPPTSTQTPAETAHRQASPPASAQAAPLVPEAERRQLTVLFCDLADSTRLARQLDPEDLRQIIRAYQATCTAVIQRYAGHIAQYLGDGLLVYFGYPQAHEDDAVRAVHTGLGMVEAISTLNTTLVRDHGVRLAVRVGIHTGLVVVGEMGSDDRPERLALGETPNLAARLQGLAAPDTVVISATTHQLVQGLFTCQTLGTPPLKGLDQPLAVSQVLGASAAQSRVEAAATSGLTPLVGREEEVGLLQRRWAQIQEGHGQVVLLSGEAGIGKSRLVRELHDIVQRDGAARLTFRCSPYYQHSALHPLIEHLQRLVQGRQEEPPETRLARLEQALQRAGVLVQVTLPLLATLLSLPHPEGYPPLHLSPERQKQKTQEALIAWLVAEAEQQPVLAVWEDLHWADPSTLEWLGLFLEQAPTVRLLTLLTCRPEFAPPWPPRAALTRLTLTRLTRPQIEDMIRQVTRGKTLPAEVMRQIVARTDGVPLFVEELTKAVLEAGWLQEGADGYELTSPVPPLAIPATLQDALRARLDRLTEGKAVAQLGAVLGRTFPHDLLQAVASLDALTVWRGLVELVQAEVLYQRGVPPQATYTFKHALLQEAAYESLLKSTRQQYHQRIAQVLTAQFPETVETQPELLAHHYTAAGLAEEAVGYWQRAGQHSHMRSAYTEAVAHYTTGLEVLQTLPDTPQRVQQELNLLLIRLEALRIVKGSAALEVEQELARARELCHQVGDSPHLFDVLMGLGGGYYQSRGELRTSRELLEQALTLAQRLHDPLRLIQAHALLGVTLYFLGELAPACTYLEQALTLRGSQSDHALRLARREPSGALVPQAYAAFTLWMLGYPEQALTRLHEMLTLAQELSHTFSLVRALHYATSLHLLRREWATAQAQAEAALALLTEQGVGQLVGTLTFQRGLALAAQGQYAEGLAQMRQGLTTKQAEGEIGRPRDLAQMAEAYGRSGQPEAGLPLLDEALAWLEKHGEDFTAAEVYRIQGELLLRQAVPDASQAEACFQRALTVARRQQARSWELRAAMSLSRLWQQQGKRAEARELLAPVYGWFTEGFETADLQDARALLDELSDEKDAMPPLASAT
jgi:predicted ATPase/class 3 adenylate cyclase